MDTDEKPPPSTVNINEGITDEQIDTNQNMNSQQKEQTDVDREMSQDEEQPSASNFSSD